VTTEKILNIAFMGIDPREEGGALGRLKSQKMNQPQEEIQGFEKHAKNSKRLERVDIAENKRGLRKMYNLQEATTKGLVEDPGLLKEQSQKELMSSRPVIKQGSSPWSGEKDELKKSAVSTSRVAGEFGECCTAKKLGS